MTFTLDIRDHIATITLDRLDVQNALPPASSKRSRARFTWAREIAAHTAALRQQFDDVMSRLGEDAWNAENARSRAGMSTEFAQERLREMRGEIIERGRGQR